MWLYRGFTRVNHKTTELKKGNKTTIIKERNQRRQRQTRITKLMDRKVSAPKLALGHIIPDMQAKS